MINRDSKCVFVAANAAEAAVVANWLEHEGVPAQVMDRMTLGGLDGLNAWTGVSARGIEVWALREDLVGRARELLAEYKDTESAMLVEKSARGPVSAQCEDCGRASVFAGDRRGKTEVCPHCGGYVDVPEEGGDASPAADAQAPGRSRGQVVEKAIIYAAAFGLMSILVVPLIAVIIDIVSRWWK